MSSSPRASLGQRLSVEIERSSPLTFSRGSSTASALSGGERSDRSSIDALHGTTGGGADGTQYHPPSYSAAVGVSISQQRRSVPASRRSHRQSSPLLPLAAQYHRSSVQRDPSPAGAQSGIEGSATPAPPLPPSQSFVLGKYHIEPPELTTEKNLYFDKEVRDYVFRGRL